MRACDKPPWAVKTQITFLWLITRQRASASQPPHNCNPKTTASAWLRDTVWWGPPWQSFDSRANSSLHSPICCVPQRPPPCDKPQLFFVLRPFLNKSNQGQYINACLLVSFPHFSGSIKISRSRPKAQNVNEFYIHGSWAHSHPSWYQCNTSISDNYYIRTRANVIILLLRGKFDILIPHNCL